MKKGKEDNFLNYIPIRKHDKFEEKDGKVKLIISHNKIPEIILRWLVKKSKVSDVEFDELGSTVWLLIDGKNTVQDIGLKVKEKFGQKCEPVFDRLTPYLRYLDRRAWITFERGNQDK